MLSWSWWLKNSSFVSARALSSRFKSSPSFSAPTFSASAAPLSGSEASNSDSSRPLSWPSTHAVHFSSNVFINVPQQGLQFLACIKETRHHRANRASDGLCNFVILQRQFAAGVEMRMRIFVRDLAVCGPAGVANAQSFCRCARWQNASEFGSFATHLEVVVRFESDFA